MISRAAIRRIQQLPDDTMVFMGFINDNPALPGNEGTSLHTRVKLALQGAGVPPTVQQQVLEDLGQARTGSGRSALYVVGADFLERHDIQADLPQRFHYGRPLKSLLAGLLDLMPSAAVLAVDREWARLFLLRQGELLELRREENVRLDDGERWDTLVSGTRHVPGAQGSGGAGRGQPGSGPRSDSGTDLFENREAAAQQRFYNRVAAELSDQLTRAEISALVLVGPVQRVAEFRAELPDKAPFEVIGETNVTGGAGWVNPAEILERIQPILTQHRETTERALLDEIQERGVMEMEPVLGHLQQARLYQLVIPEDGAQVHVYRSHNRDVPYFTSRKDVPHSPLDDSLMEQVSLEELLPDLMDLYGIDVRRVHGEQAQRLVREFGGLAGLLRY